MADSLARSFASNLNAVGLSVAAVAQTPGGAADPALAGACPGGARRRARLRTADAEDQAVSQSTFFAIGMAVFFLFFAVEFGVRGLLEERGGGHALAPAGRARDPRLGDRRQGARELRGGPVSTVLLVIATTWLLDAHVG